MNAPEKPWLFKPGHTKPGPGRPIGSRSRLSETMLALLAADAAENGAEVIAKVRKEKPHVWLQCMVALLPRQLNIEKVSPLGDLSDEELQAVEEMVAAARAKTVEALKPREIEPAIELKND